MVVQELIEFSSIPALRELIAEYMATLPFDISYQSPNEELDDLSSLYGSEARGAMFVAEEDGELAGCVALKDIGDGRCEMKRLYVREKYRGQNLGRQLAEAIVSRAKEMGYQFMYLDTHREAQAKAIAMYMKMGFVECADYHPNPGRLLCLELKLTT